MATSVGALTLNAVASRSTTNALGTCTVSVIGVDVHVVTNRNDSAKYLHCRVLINGQQVSYKNRYVARRQSGIHCYPPDGSLAINKTTAAQSIAVVVQASVTSSESPGSWTNIASYTITVPALSTSHYDFYNDEAMTDLYERIDVYETQYLTVPSAIPSVEMSEWVDSNGITYQFGAQVQNTSMQEQTYKFRPVFLAPDIKAKVKVSGEWVDGDIKCKVNGEWVDADAVYVKVGGEWIEIS